MEKFITHTGKPVAIYQPNIDTDQIVPKKFLLRISRAGFAEALFSEWRFESDGTSKSEFVLNQPRYENASVLLAGKNFGCGSSREHAPWALEDYGFKVIIASAFADIFYNNCFKIGLLPIVLDEENVAELVKKSKTINDYNLTVDLDTQTVSDEFGFSSGFEVEEFRKFCLINGLDDIGLTLQNEAKITEFEKSRPSFSVKI